MADIKVLSKHLANKIAAGEVIERPASVVKELVENALDAGASAVDVEVADGGRRLVRVRDNGLGMGPEDLALAFAPHATSKIADEEDLYNIHTMGFRGEALASIGAVARAHVVSRRRPAPGEPPPDAAHEVTCAGGRVEPVRPAAAAEGTTVTVRDLFFNTPARRKFMRTANTEFGHVVEQLARLALPHRQVAFTLTHNDRCTHRLPAAETVRRRAADFFGPELAEAMIEFADDDDGLKLYGLVAPPAHARSSAKWQYFFVNGRCVRDRLLAHALREACRGLIDPARAPVALIFIEMDPAEVDVNVHPAKVEVRFRNGRQVHSHLLGALRDAHNRADLAPAVRLAGPDAAPDASEPAPDDTPAGHRRQSLKQALADFLRSQPRPQARLDFPPPRDRPAAPPAGDYVPTRPPSTAPGAPAPAGPVDRPAGPAFPPAAEPRRRAIQVHNSYIVSETDDGLVIVDQHALHERVLFEELTRRIASGGLAAQRLLIPARVEVTESERASLNERADLLDRLGLEVTDFGPNAVAVHKFPALLAERNVAPPEFLRDLLDLLVERAGDETGPLLEAVLSTMACKAAVKAGEPLAADEMEALLARRRRTERADACPHGRPTTLNLTLADLARQFNRT